MSHHCTFFDHRYMARGLVMIRSLRQVEPGAQVWVLCLDETARGILTRIQEPGVRIIALADFDEADPELASARHDGRSLVEYYFSVKASLIALVLKSAPDADRVTYLDGDLWFFANQDPIFAEMPTASVLLTPHRFAPGQQALEIYGKYNAGWLSFRRTPDGLACLAWWRERCLEWCHDRVDEAGARYADQRYLDRFADLFTGIHAIRHRGANVAPWNLGLHRLSLRDGSARVDRSDPLLFFHVHGLKPLGRRFYLSPADTFGSGRDRLAQKIIYRPYLAAVRATDRELAPLMPLSSGPIRAQSPAGGLATELKKRLRIARAALRGHVIRLGN